jgi:hypothetical protein
MGRFALGRREALAPHDPLRQVAAQCGPPRQLLLRCGEDTLRRAEHLQQVHDALYSDSGNQRKRNIFDGLGGHNVGSGSVKVNIFTKNRKVAPKFWNFWKSSYICTPETMKGPCCDELRTLPGGRACRSYDTGTDRV